MTLKSQLIRWCELTTCAGVLDILRARTRLERFFWLSCVVVGLGLTAWQMYNMFHDFIYDDPFQTSVTVVSNNVLTFPNVSICNFNRIDKSKIGPFDKDALSYAFASADVSYVFDFYETGSNLTTFRNAWRQLSVRLSVENVAQLFERYGHSCSDMFIACYFLGTPFDCCDNAFETITSFGRCFTIVVDESTSRIQLQTALGLKVVIDPRLEDYIEDTIVNNILEAGAFVQIGYTQSAFLDDFKVLLPGTHNWISLAASVNKYKSYRTPIRSKNCRSNTTLKYLSVPYSKENCRVDCYVNELFLACNCATVYPFREEFRVCTPDEHIDCVVPFRTKFWSDALEDSPDNQLMACALECLFPCEPFWSIKSSVTSVNSMFSARRAEAVSNEILALAGYRADLPTLTSIIILDIYFPTLDYTEIETGERYPVFEFIANVGGQLGLWLGLSIFTVVQFLVYAISCLFCCEQQKPKPKYFVK